MRRTSLADALFPSVQQRLLALLFGQPDRSFQSAELIRLARGGTGGAHRCLARLAEAGWLSVERIGNQKHYRANRACPAFEELRALVARTLGERKRDAGRAARARGAVTAYAEFSEESSATEPVREDGWRAW